MGPLALQGVADRLQETVLRVFPPEMIFGPGDRDAALPGAPWPRVTDLVKQVGPSLRPWPRQAPPAPKAVRGVR